MNTINIRLLILLSTFLLSVSNAFSQNLDLAQQVSTMSEAQLEEKSNEVTQELHNALKNTEILTAVNAKKIRSSFEDSFLFVTGVIERSDIPETKRVDLVSPVLKSIGVAFGDLAEPFVNLKDSSQYVKPEGIIGNISQWIDQTFHFIGRFAKFWVGSWFIRGEENPLRTFRRTSIGKEVMGDLSDSLNAVVEMHEKSGSAEKIANSELIRTFSEVMERALKSDPYKYRPVAKTAIWSFVLLASYYVLTPIDVQKHLPLFPIDYFPPFTFMDRTYGSVLTARGLWAIYAGVWYKSGRLFSGVGLGDRIAKMNKQLEAIRTGRKVDCRSMLDKVKDIFVQTKK